jgi:uncharacterized protein
MVLKERRAIPPRTGAGFKVPRGRLIKVIDIEGGQVADLVAFRSGDPAEFLSMPATIDSNASIAAGKGSDLYSNLYTVMLRIIEDTVGKHDLIHPACSPAMYRAQYGVAGDHPSCERNLLDALEGFSIRPVRLPTPFNIFMNSEVGPGGKVVVREPLSKRGDYVLFEAQMDMVMALSACSVEESACNSHRCAPIGIEIRGV